MTQTALILGATGRFGRHAAQQFAAAGWQVRRFSRDRDNLSQAANGAEVIVNGWNPPYTEWAQSLPGLHQQVISAARDSGATVIVPGNVYVFGERTPAPWSGNTPHAATNPLGRARIAMEDAYRRAGIPTIILRAGDFLDTTASGNWFDRIMTPKLDRGVLVYPGDPQADHAWAYLPDLARAAVELAERRGDLPEFADIAFPGFTLTGHDLAGALTRITGRQVRIRRMNWLPLHLSRPFWPMASSLLEMRYLWQVPHQLQAKRFRSLLPGFQDTPLNEALASAIPQALVDAQINPNQPVTAGG